MKPKRKNVGTLPARLSSPTAGKSKRISTDNSVTETQLSAFEKINFDEFTSLTKIIQASERDDQDRKLSRNNEVDIQRDFEKFVLELNRVDKAVESDGFCPEELDLSDDDLEPKNPNFKVVGEEDAKRLHSANTENLLTICALPEEFEEPECSEWLNSKHPSQFWFWCFADFLKPLDSEFMRNFKENIMDRYGSQDALRDLFVNEPWKYRKRNNRKMTSPRSSSPQSKRIRSFVEDKKEDCKRRCLRERAPSFVDELMDVVCREMKQDEPEPVTSRRYSERLQTREENGRIEEENSALMDENAVDGLNFNRSLRSPPKFDTQEEDEDGESIMNIQSPCSSTRRRLSMDAKRNGFADTNGSLETNGFHDVKDGIMNDFDDCTKKAVGEKVVQRLIADGIVPDYSTQTYEVMKNDVHISNEGKESSDDDELDEVSQALLEAQQELREASTDVFVSMQHAWKKLKSDYAYWRTEKNLSTADYDLFEYAVNMYQEIPKRVPTHTEWPKLTKAFIRRNKLARIHYGSVYRRQPMFFRRAASPVQNESGKTSK